MLDPSSGGTGAGDMSGASGRHLPSTGPARGPGDRPDGTAAKARAILVHLAALARPESGRDRVWLAGLVLLDLLVIAAFLAYARAEHYGLRDSLFYGNVRFSFVDGGYPEIYGYAKQALIAWLMWSTYRMGGQPVHRALAVLFAVVLADDALTLHESFGALLGAAGVPTRLGELTAWALIGLAPLILVAAGYRRSDTPARADGQAVLAGFALLLFFAIGMDAVHGLAGRYVSGFQTLLTLAEDGGELVTLTLLCLIARRLPARREALRTRRAEADPSR